MKQFIILTLSLFAISAGANEFAGLTGEYILVNGSEHCESSLDINNEAETFSISMDDDYLVNTNISNINQGDYDESSSGSQGHAQLDISPENDQLNYSESGRLGFGENGPKLYPYYIDLTIVKKDENTLNLELRSLGALGTLGILNMNCIYAK